MYRLINVLFILQINRVYYYYNVLLGIMMH